MSPFDSAGALRRLFDDPADTELDEDFPLGDGVVDAAAHVTCPYCAETIEVVLDPGSGSHQRYVEDCEVCCQPWEVTVSYDADGQAMVSVDAADGR